MCLAALDFDVPWKQQDKVRLGNLYTLVSVCLIEHATLTTIRQIREKIPRFCRFANNWAGELVVQDIFNHKRTHMLKLERKKKTPGTPRAGEKGGGKYNNNS